MLAEFSRNLAGRIAKDDFDAEHLEVCAYGIDIALYTKSSPVCGFLLHSGEPFSYVVLSR